MKNFTTLSKNRFYSALWPVFVLLFLFSGHYFERFETSPEKGGDAELPVTNYVTTQNGNWNSGSTWVDGSAPGSALSGDNVTIRHEVNYDMGSDLEISDGSVLAIDGTAGTTAALTVPSSRSIKVGESGSGTFTIDDGKLDMQGTGGNLSLNESGTIDFNSAEVRVSSNWESLHSTASRSISGGCIFVQQNFGNKGHDLYNGVCLEIGTGGSGNFLNEGVIQIGSNGIAVNVSNGNFKNTSSGFINPAPGGGGDFLFVKVKSGEDITNEAGDDWDSSIELKEYCLSGGDGSVDDVPGAPASEDCGVESTYFPCTDCVGNLNPLPVEISSFTGLAMDKSNMLKWTTGSEADNAYFQVGRSVDGRSFEIIGQVEGVGFTEEESHYHFEDKSPIAIAYYRLQQVDISGNFTFSSIVSIEREKFDIDLAVYPNIVEEEVTIRINTLGDLQDTRKYILKVVSAQGMVQYEEVLRSPNYTEYIDLNVKDYQPGMYYVFLQNQKDQYSTKFVVQNKK